MAGTSVTVLAIVVAWLSLAALHVGYLALTRARHGRPSTPAASAGLLAVLIAVGPVALWAVLGPVDGSGAGGGTAPASLKAGAVFLYLAGCIVYLELRSLLSRGYSLRILLDLLGRSGAATVEGLKTTYGNGMGVQGMLTRRVRTLAWLRLLELDGARVGPLTPLGRVCAAAGWWMRRALRLEAAG